MRTLLNTLSDQDQGFLRIIAELWGVDLPSGSARQMAEALSESMLDPEYFEEVIAALSPDAIGALLELVGHGGNLPWHTWSRKYGDIRAMGPGKRDRDQPWRGTNSASEALWYRGLIGRAFTDTPKGPEEFAYLPTEVFERLSERREAAEASNLAPIAPPSHHEQAAATLIDDCTTLLAAFRRQTNTSSELLNHPSMISQLIHPESRSLCLALMSEVRVIHKGTMEADLDAVPDFLLADRMLILQQLFTSWINTLAWNDMAALPTLRTGRDPWPNDPLLPRQILLRWLSKLKVGEWYRLADLVKAIYQEDPAFQRPGGQFDTWYLQDSEGVPLDGIEHWYAVEGALLRSLVTGPLRWFGAVEVGYEKGSRGVYAFTPTKLLKLLQQPGANLPAVEEKGLAIIRGDGTVSVPRLTPRSVRYQLARLLEWEGLKGHIYQYRLSVRAIHRAMRQGLEIKQVRTILTQASGGELPNAVLNAMQHYQEQSYEAQIDRTQLLRVSDPSLLETLLRQRATKQFIVERLNETTAIVRYEGWKKLVRAAVSVGILIDGPEQDLPS